MTKGSRAVMSIGYWFGAHSLGLLMHPYQSMRRIVRQEVFVPLVMLPGVCLVGWWMVGVLVGHFPVLAKFGFGFLAISLDKLGWVRLSLYFGFVWVGMFLILWQCLLLYLYWRFSKVADVKKNTKGL